MGLWLAWLQKVPALYSLAALLVARRVVVKGWSMAPTLLPGERVLVDRLAYWGAAPRRGDVVVLCHPREKGRLLLKRVAALPGETVRLTPEGVWANGARVGVLEGPGQPLERGWALGAGEYFLVGDAFLSTDGRSLGPVPRQDILGKAWLVYWPPSHRRRVQ